MSKSYKDSWVAWGEYRKERSRREDFKNWKQEALEELNMASVFVIINEWENEAGGGSEITGGEYFDSESEAWDALKLVADEVGKPLPKDQNNIIVVSTEGEYESYYIEELLKSDA